MTNDLKRFRIMFLMAINNLAKELIIRFKINRFIETGIYEGETMMLVSQWFNEIYKGKGYFIFEIDNNKEYCNNARKMAENDRRVIISQGDSVESLRFLIWRFILPWDHLLVFLDAHWEKYWPLRDEIKQLLYLRSKPIILIDDYKTPGRNYAYDTWNYNDCGTEYIKDLIKDRVEKVYMFDKPNKDNRTCGILFVDRKEAEIDKILKGIPVIKEVLN